MNKILHRVRFAPSAVRTKQWECFMDAVDQVLSFFGKVVLVGGSGAGVAFLLFQYLGKGWIDARFAERLEAFKHEQAKELHRLKVEVESVLSGTLKMQDREFTVLPEAWHKLNEAYSHTAAVCSPLQQYPPVGRLNDAELQEFLVTTELRQTQKDDISDGDRLERDKKYQEAIFWHKLSGAKRAVGALQNYVIAHGLFLPSPLKQMFLEMHPLLHSSLIKLEIGHDGNDWKMQGEAWSDLKSKAESLHSAIEVAIEQRLHSHRTRLE
jgi:hypothetical protein